MAIAPGYILWLGIMVLQVLALYIAIKCGQVRRFWDLYLLFGMDFAVSVLRFVILHRNGLSSTEYAYIYYCTDAILVLNTFLIVVRLFVYAYNFKTWNGIPVRLTIAGVMCLAMFSYGVVHQAEAKRMLRFVLEMDQNLCFAILLLAAGGWVGVVAKKLRGSAEVKLIWVFAIYETILATEYASRNIHPGLQVYHQVMSQFAGLWLVAGCAFAVLFDDAQLT